MATLTVDLPSDLRKGLQEEAEKRGLTVVEFVQWALEALVARPGSAAGATPPAVRDTREPTTGDSILAMMEEIWAQVPAAEWDKLPPDLSENLDHYLYGAPKQP